MHKSKADTVASTYDPNVEFIIGAGRSADLQSFHGKIDDIRVYNRELSYNEIKLLYREK